MNIVFLEKILGPFQLVFMHFSNKKVTVVYLPEINDGFTQNINVTEFFTQSNAIYRLVFFNQLFKATTYQ